MDKIEIRPAEAEEVIDLRWRVLREGLARETAYFDGDRDPTTRHFLAVQDGRILGCVTVLQRPWLTQPAWQMRGMAVEPSAQRSGIGRQLVETVEQLVGQSDFSHLLWCNARKPAVAFYLRLGWQIVGEEFIVPTAGPHFKMVKYFEKPMGSGNSDKL